MFKCVTVATFPIIFLYSSHSWKYFPNYYRERGVFSKISVMPKSRFPSDHKQSDSYQRKAAFVKREQGRAKPKFNISPWIEIVAKGQVFRVNLISDPIKR